MLKSHESLSFYTLGSTPPHWHETPSHWHVTIFYFLCNCESTTLSNICKFCYQLSRAFNKKIIQNTMLVLITLWEK